MSYNTVTFFRLLTVIANELERHRKSLQMSSVCYTHTESRIHISGQFPFITTNALVQRIAVCSVQPQLYVWNNGGGGGLLFQGFLILRLLQVLPEAVFSVMAAWRVLSSWRPPKQNLSLESRSWLLRVKPTALVVHHIWPLRLTSFK